MLDHDGHNLWSNTVYIMPTYRAYYFGWFSSTYTFELAGSFTIDTTYPCLYDYLTLITLNTLDDVTYIRELEHQTSYVVTGEPTCDGYTGHTNTGSI